jgi:hypothetical protein
MWLGEALKMAKDGRVPMPDGAYQEKGDFDGESTLWERTVLEYCGDDRWFGLVQRNVLPVEKGDGKTPQTAMPTNRPSTPFKYFTEQHRFGYTIYFHNTAPGAIGADPRWPKDHIPKQEGAGGGGGTPTGGGETEKLDRLKQAAEALRAKLPKAGGAPMRMLVAEVTKFLDLIKGA